MILHVGNVSRFVSSFVTFVNVEFEKETHFFWINGDKKKKNSVENISNVYLAKGTFPAVLYSYIFLLFKMHTAEKIVLHGLFDPRLLILLACCPWMLSKCYWVIWGGDLYQYKASKNGLQAKIKETLRKFVIRRIGHLVTYIEGDVDLARKWYGAKGVYHECLMYVSNVIDPTTLIEPDKKTENGGLRILLGNSADPSNNHIEALERLLAYKDRDITIFAPLSYGDQYHAKKVIEQGREWFGDKFIPLTELMPIDEYLGFLKSLDIAIFSHRRQQAMGNTITLLALGKTVFMRCDVSQWRFLTGLGITLKDVGGLTLQPIERQTAQENSQIVQSYFSRETLIKQLSVIFEEQYGLS